MQLPEKIAGKLRELPDRPGCYLMRDATGRIIYVGKALSLRKRVQSYFRSATLRSADPKLRGLIRTVADFDIVVVRNEAEAALTEGQLIKDYRPRYNVSFKDDKRFLLLRAAAGAPFPRFTLCRLKREDGALYFGPYASSAAARVTLDFVEKRFGLRKCAPAFPDAETYRHCINDVIRYCSAPCVGRVTEEEYAARFNEACAFLRGERMGVLGELKEAMEAAAGSQEFEKAAALRDLFLSLHATIRQRARVSPSADLKRNDAKEGLAELMGVLNLRGPPRLIEAFDISNIFGSFAVAGMVACVDGFPLRRRYRRFRIRTVAGPDDPAMMAEVVRRRYSSLLEEGGEMPDLVLVDGGVAQMGAARAVLDGMGLGSMPVAGLAKKFEELHLAAGTSPVRLPGDSKGLRVLSRLRDEAHRFALDYHRRIRERRIRESRLDEIAGIGDKKKARLLAAFGSVKNIERAGEEAVASVPGIGRAMAREIMAGLRSGDASPGQAAERMTQ